MPGRTRPAPGTRSWPVRTRPWWPGTRRHERLTACAAHAAARCCRRDSFANPGRRRLTIAYDAAGTPASPGTRRLSSLLAGSMMRASPN